MLIPLLYTDKFSYKALRYDGNPPQRAMEPLAPRQDAINSRPPTVMASTAPYPTCFMVSFPDFSTLVTPSTHLRELG